MTTALRPSDDVVAERVGEEMVLVHLGSNKIYELNATAARFWELAGQVGTLEGVRAALRDEFEVGADELDREIAKFLETAKADRLIIVEDTA